MPAGRQEPGMTMFGVILILLFFFFQNNSVFAEGEKFSVTSDSTYKIAENGLATVTQNFTFTNLTTQYFPAQYLANLPQKEVYNLRAYDKTGALKIETKIVDNIRQINIQFGNQTIGEGKQITWTVTYETWEVAKKQGSLWEIFVPRPSTLEGQTNFSVGLYLPDSFGKKIYIKPEPMLENHIWTDIKGAGIFAVYDSLNREEPYQGYDFKLTYNIYNPKLYPAYLEIALPPDTTRQKVFINDISPRPVNVRKDENGNWLARYQLGPTQKQNVVAKGSLAIFLNDKFSGTFVNYDKYLKIDDTKIPENSPDLKTPEDVYQFSVSYLPDDKTNLFVSLCRNLGIPAREIVGFANGELHSWPEYYNYEKAAWIPVDPSWGRKTNGTDYFNILDFDHLIFAIGNPKPPDSFEITVHEGDLDIEIQPKLGFSTDVPLRITSGFPAVAKIFLENYGPTSFAGGNVFFNEEGLPTGELLPFAKKTVEYKILPKPWLADENDIINLKFERQERTFNVSSKPFFRNNFILTVSILFTLGLISVIAQIARSIYLSQQKRESNLRGKSQKSSR